MMVFIRKKSAKIVLFFVMLLVYTLSVLRINQWSTGNKDNFSNVIEELRKKSFDLVVKKKAVNDQNKYSNELQKKQFLNEKPKKTKRESCELINHQLYPLCKEKYDYIKIMWNSLHCLKDVHGVNGSHCSIYNYLTKVEPFCASEKPNDYDIKKMNEPLAVARTDLQGFLDLMPGELYQWLRQRATDMWDDWVYAVEKFQSHKHQYKKKKIAAFLGSMAFQPHMLTYAGKGGPLGELVQWTDLIASLYILGHDVQVFLDVKKLGFEKDVEGCAAPASDVRIFDIMYTDLNGVQMIHNEYGYASSAKYRCIYRILDSFGTFPEYNYPSYPHKLPGGRSAWANMNLNPLQFNTLYPHTQDNTFLGFVVGSGRVNGKPEGSLVKKDKALLYAKRGSYIATPEIKKYLKIVSEYFEIHATAVSNKPLPNFIINHGSVSGLKIKEMLLESKLFIGVGFPYEGPGPIEAMATGTPYIQPKYKIPKNKLNDEFFKDKPTIRELTSQSPYMEEFVGEPYAFTIDITDEPLLRKTLNKIKTMKTLPPKITEEFTNEGMLERIHVSTEHVDFCDIYKPRWPSIDHMTVHVAELGQSCKDVCMSKGLVCERSFFDDINTVEVMERSTQRKCIANKSIIHLHAPSFDPASQICYLQSQPQVYSCSHRDKQMKQICPCRDYEKEQSALCKGCL